MTKILDFYEWARERINIGTLREAGPGWSADRHTFGRPDYKHTSGCYLRLGEHGVWRIYAPCGRVSTLVDTADEAHRAAIGWSDE